MGDRVQNTPRGCVVKTKERVILVRHKKKVTKETLKQVLAILDVANDDKDNLNKEVDASGESIHVFVVEPPK
jgi:hypothetical protein